MPRSGLEVAAGRLAYRVAYRILQLRALLIGHHGRGVKCLLVDDDGAFLLVRHAYGDRATWHIPGGGVRRGETLAQAAAREMREELGIGDLEPRPLTTVTVRAPRRATSIPCVWASLSQSTELHPDPIEILQAAWFTRATLPATAGEDARELARLALPPRASDNVSDNQERMR